MKKATLIHYSFGFIAFLLLSITGMAQQRQVTGVVQDAKSNAPLEGATISVKNTKTNTITKADGKFEITIPNGKTMLTISFVGYASQSITVGVNETNVIVPLSESSTTQLSDVIVIGYGTQKKKDLTGSVSSIKSDQLTLGGTTSNIAQAIQGKAAGVQVQQSDFSPGGTIAITVRGGNSINSTNEPLFVVDGFITDNGKFINPNDIADIQILKDASATAIYGSRGGNGVVLITTKKGKAGKMLIEGDFSNGYQYLTYKPSLLNGTQYADIQNATAAEDGKPPLFPPSFPIANTNWWNKTTQQSSVLNRSVSLSGSDKNSKIYISGNYIKQNGVLKSTDLERYSVRIGAEKRFSERVNVGANFYGASTISHTQRYVSDITAPLYSVFTAPPSIPVYNKDGSYYKYLGKDNALAILLEPTNLTNNKLMNGNMFVDYDIIKNLTYHLGAGAEYSQNTFGQYIPKTLVSGQANNGIALEQINNSFRWLAEQYLTYKYSIGSHALTAVVGTSNQKDVFDGLGAGSRGYSTDVYLFYNLNAGSVPTISGTPTPTSSKTEQKLTSYYGRLNYSFKDKILATFTFRHDGSSRFAPNYKYGNFPSGAIAWRLSDEPFMKKVTLFSNLKVRASYGVTGNDRIGSSYYPYLATFSNYGTSLGASPDFSGGIEPTSLSNNNLKWESNTQADIGIDMGFLDGKINATIDLYRKKTSDLLLSVPIGQWWGFSSQIQNAGSIENKGIELSINSENFRTKNFTWSSTFNIAYNRQKSLSLANNVKIISTNTANPSGVVSGREFTRLEPGKELGVIYGFVYDGVVKTGEHYTAQPNSKPGDPKYKDLNGDGVITPADRTYLGNTNPRYIAGFGNDFFYKGLDLNIFFQGAFGNHLYNMNRLVLESTTSTDALKRWVSGTNENTSIPREGYFITTYGSYVNSRFVENASYIRLKSVSLGYNVPVNLIKQIKFIEGLRIYVTGQNLLTITKYTGTDPEVNSHGANGNANVAGGIDFNSFPAFRTFVFGVKLSIH